MTTEAQIIAAARAFLGQYGPANLEDLLGQQGQIAPVAIFFTLPDGRRIAASRYKAYGTTGDYRFAFPSPTFDCLWVSFLDGRQAGDDHFVLAIVDLMWRPNPQGCAIKTSTVVNGVPT